MPGSERKMALKAYAKINLALEVLGKRPDGFHEVSMIMQAVSLHDTVTLTLQSDGITLACDHAGLPCDSGNLAFRAALLVQQECGVDKGVHIELEKRIPLAAGLAGGSSDAAAVLRGLNTLWELGLSAGELERLAARLGSDVPFCLWGGTVHATGRGEILRPLPELAGFGVVLAQLPLEVSTAWVYGNFRLNCLCDGPDIARMVQAVSERSFTAVATNLFNVLETVTVPAHPQIAAVKRSMSEAGAGGVLMSGSGPTVFALTPDLSSAHELAGRLSVEPGVSIIVAETIAREEQMNGPSIVTGQTG